MAIPSPMSLCIARAAVCAGHAGLMFFLNWTYLSGILGPEGSGNGFLQDKRVNRPAIPARVIPLATRGLTIPSFVIKRARLGIVRGDLQKGGARATCLRCRFKGGKTGAGKALASMLGIGGQRQKLGLVLNGAAKGKSTRIAQGENQRALQKGGDLLRIGLGHVFRRHRQG